MQFNPARKAFLAQLRSEPRLGALFGRAARASPDGGFE